MGRTKKLLVEEDWERTWELDYMYRMEQQRQEEQEWLGRKPARIEVIDLRKEKHEDEYSFLPF